MRTKQYWMILLFVPFFFSVSCKKFLDVNSSNQIMQETMFKDAAGIRIAVNGVYRLLSTADLYGKNLTWGFATAMAQTYDDRFIYNELGALSRFEWESISAQNGLEQVWSRAYNVLANCNNIIQVVQAKDTGFFPQGSNEKNMILGEMYGIRALVHFDLLRLFAPAPVTGYSGAAIPYVTTYPEYQPARLNMATVFTKITEDMTNAQSLLTSIDTIYLRQIMRSSVGRIRNPGSYFNLPQGEFFNYRCERMNYFAATALLARIYLYKGEYENAFKNAKIVYDAQKRNWFQWTASMNQGEITDPEYIFTKRPDEIVLSFSNAKNYENYESLMSQPGSQMFRLPDRYMEFLFDVDTDDFRKAGWYDRYNDKRYLTWARPRGTSYYADLTLKQQGPLLPVLRFSEMYHIMIEYYIRNGNVTDAVPILNDLRTRRGAKLKIPNTISAADLMEKLVKDITRETLTEGQTFFLYKRLNRNIFKGETDRVMTAKDWTAPLPLSETAYLL